MMGFLAALPLEYDSVKAQIMSSPKILSFQENIQQDTPHRDLLIYSFCADEQCPLLVGTMVSQKSNNIEKVVQAATLKGQVLEELFVITAISMAK